MTKSAILVRPGFEGELVREFLSSSAAWVGWDKIGDVSRLTPAEIESLLLSVYPGCRTADGRPNKHHREIIEFALVAKVGDIVVTPDTANGRLIVGQVKSPYRFETLSTVRSGHEVFRHSLPTRWTHSVSRFSVDAEVLKDTDQRGKTTFWLRPETAQALEKAPCLSL